MLAEVHPYLVTSAPGSLLNPPSCEVHHNDRLLSNRFLSVQSTYVTFIDIQACLHIYCTYIITLHRLMFKCMWHYGINVCEKQKMEYRVDRALTWQEIKCWRLIWLFVRVCVCECWFSSRQFVVDLGLVPAPWYAWDSLDTLQVWLQTLGSHALLLLMDEEPEV